MAVEVHEDQPLPAPPVAPTRQFWVTAPDTAAATGYPPMLGLGMQCWLSFMVPHDWTAMMTMLLDLVPAANHVCNITLQGRVGACGEGIATHWQNAAINQAIVANTNNCVDLVPLFGALLALVNPGDIFVVRIINNIVLGSAIYGMAVRYN